MNESRLAGSVKAGALIRGKVSLQPRLIVPSFGCNSTIYDSINASFGLFELHQAVASVVVPVERTVLRCRLEQQTCEGWSRLLPSAPQIGPEPTFFPPVLISARDHWAQVANGMEVFDRGYVLDGACRLELAARCGSPAIVPVFVLFGLGASDEITVRRNLTSGSPVSDKSGSLTTIEASTQRLEIGTMWTEMVIESDPFVVPTALGYAPAIIVRRDHAPQREHLLIGARSLAKPLEHLRVRRETLSGARVKIRKSGAERTALYEVRDLG